MKLVMYLPLVVVAACSKPSRFEQEQARSKEVFAQHRTELTALVDKVLHEAIDPVPPLTSDTVTGISALSTHWSLSSMDAGNAVVVLEWKAKALLGGHFFDKDKDGAVGPNDETPRGLHVGRFMASKDTTDFNDLAWWALYRSVRGDTPTTYEYPEKSVDKYLAIKYVVVIRVLDYKAPVIQWSKESSTDATYTPGHAIGEARIFDVGGHDHGGVRFVAENEGTMKLEADEVGRADDELLEGLAFSAMEQIEAKLKPQIAKLDLP